VRRSKLRVKALAERVCGTLQWLRGLLSSRGRSIRLSGVSCIEAMALVLPVASPRSVLGSCTQYNMEAAKGGGGVAKRRVLCLVLDYLQPGRGPSFRASKSHYGHAQMQVHLASRSRIGCTVNRCCTEGNWPAVRRHICAGVRAGVDAHGTSTHLDYGS